MVANRNQQIVLGVLVGAVALVAYQVWPPSAAVPASSSNGRAAGKRAEQAMPSPAAAPAVHLRALEAARPNPLARDRNLFGFKPKAPPPPPPVVRAPFVPPPPSAAPPSPRLPPIPYRFNGIVEAPDRALTIAMLSDGAGHVLRGRVGDVIEGRYRILRIGPDSIEMAYPDGRGRQTIRLTGS